MMKLTLSPIKTERPAKWGFTKTYVENVVIISDGYPWAVAHIDAFHNPDNQDIYKRLQDGEIVNVELSIAPDEISEQDKKEAERVQSAILAGMPG